MRKVLSLVLFLVGPFANANINGSDFQSFNPTSDGLDFVTVESVRTLPKGVLGVGTFFDLAWDTLPPAIDQNGAKYTVHDRMLSNDVHAALGLTRSLEFGFNISSLVAGKVFDERLDTYVARNGMTDARVNLKYRLSGTKDEGWALLGNVNFPQLTNDPFYGGGNSPAYVVQAAGQTHLGSFLWGTNGGVRLRNPGAKLAKAPYEPVGSEILLSTALSYRFASEKWYAIGELYSAIPFKGSDNYSQGEMTALEALLGLKYTGVKHFSFNGGVTGSRNIQGTSSPILRFYVGLNWYPATLWGDDKAPEPTPVANVEPIAEAAMTPEPEPAPIVAQVSDNSVFNKTSTAKVESLTVQGIRFSSGSYAIEPQFRGYLAKMGEYLKRGRPLKKLTVTGHTDSQGRPEANQTLSERRAEAVAKMLVSESQIPADKIETRGMGDRQPIDTNATPLGRSHNRRIDFRIDRE